LSYGGDVSALSVSQAFDATGASFLVLADSLGNNILVQGGFAGAVANFDFGAGQTFTQRGLMSQVQTGALTLTGSAASDDLIGGNSADNLNGAPAPISWRGSAAMTCSTAAWEPIR